MEQGTVKWFNDARASLHYAREQQRRCSFTSAINANGFRSLQEGQRAVQRRGAKGFRPRTFSLSK